MSLSAPWINRPVIRTRKTIREMLQDELEKKYSLTLTLITKQKESLYNEV